MQVRRDVKGSALAVEPYLAWNEFVNILAMTDHKDLDGIQRSAQLVFWYEHEVQNGGHHQFFLNPSGEHAHDTVGALKALNAGAQANVLERAIRVWESRPRRQPANIEEFVEEEREYEFQSFDHEFAICEPNLQEILERHLNEDLGRYVRLVD